MLLLLLSYPIKKKKQDRKKCNYVIYYIYMCVYIYIMRKNLGFGCNDTHYISDRISGL